MRHSRERKDPLMASLASLLGTGGGRIPLGDKRTPVSRHDLVAIIAAMPTASCRAMHIAARQGDRTTAQRLLRAATEAYFASTPAAPTAPSVTLHHSASRQSGTRRRSRS